MVRASIPSSSRGRALAGALLVATLPTGVGWATPAGPDRAAAGGAAVAPRSRQEVELSGGFPVTSRAAIFPIERLKRGDRGIGYTVFAEDRITTFDVEVLGVLENMLGPKRDVVLARLSGPEIEFTGVISGMSGSPVYIDGKLLGAVSYRFGAFSKEPIAGITPIGSMLSIFDSPEIEPPTPGGGSSAGTRPVGSPRQPSGGRSRTRLATASLGRSALGSAPGERARGIRTSDFRAREGLPAPSLPRPEFHATRSEPSGGAVAVGPSELVPIETPIGVSGLDPRVAAELMAELRAAGFATAAGSGRSGGLLEPTAKRKVAANLSSESGRVRAAPILPGAPIAAVLVRGDVYIAATGTVTLVDGPEVLAFGHPFLGYGHVVFPMATASILNTLATPLGSYKQGSTALEVGAITHDRLTAIGGRLGEAAPMVRLRVRVERGDVDAPSTTPGSVLTTEVEIVKDAVWMPMLAASVIANAAIGRLGFEAGGTVDLRAGIDVGDRRLAFEDTYAAEAPVPVAAFAARDIANTLGLIARNDLAPADITNVEVELRVRATPAAAVVEEVVPDRSVVRPGSTLGLTARVRPLDRPPVKVRISVDIPADARGDAEVYVGGGVELDRRDGEVYGDRLPRTVDELLGILADRRPGRALFARVYLPRPGLRSSAELLSSLPPSQRVALALEPGRGTKAVTEALGPAATVPYPDVIAGGVAIPITVVR